MTQLPQASGREVTAALSKMRYEKDRQRGRHIVMPPIVHSHRRITVPDHREIATRTLRAIIKQAGLTTEEFKQLL